MKFTLSNKSINKLIAYSKEFLNAKIRHDFCHVAFCTLDNGRLTITMTDTFSVCNFILPIVYCDGDDTSGKFVIGIPSCKFISDFVVIEAGARVTRYHYDGRECEVEHPYITYDCPDFSYLFSPVLQSIYVDAKLLSSSLKPFGKSIVRLDLCSNSKSSGLAITKEGERAFVLPCRVEADISYIGGNLERNSSDDQL